MSKPRTWVGRIEYVIECRSGAEKHWWEWTTKTTRAAARREAVAWLTDPDTWAGSSARIVRVTRSKAVEVLP